MPLLSASDLGVNYGADIIFSGISLEVHEKARIGIVGPNGGGKTSLLKVLVGDMDASAGSVQRTRGIRVGYVPQFAEDRSGDTLRDRIMTAFDRLLWLERELESSAARLEQSQQEASRYAALTEEYETGGGYTYQRDLELMAEGLGLSKTALDTPSSQASGGERTRAALAKALLGNPDLLVLDEPTNYLDLKGVTWLERYLTHYSPAVVVVSHDRYFLDQTVSQIWEIDHGRLRAFPGNFTRYRELKAEQDQRRWTEYQAQQEYIAKEQAFIQRYRAGQRSQEAKGRETRLQRLERIQRPDREQFVNLARTQAKATRTGQVVASTRNLKVGFVGEDGPVELLTVPGLKLERGGRTAIIGDNGTGKTTLVRTLLGQTPPLSGEVALGHNVSVGYYAQGQDSLRDDQTVLDSFLDIKNMPFEQARSYLARFLFQGDDVFRKVGVCSGGERSRLSLARLLITEPNLLVLDEPTTHFDIPSREALEQVLSVFDGALLLVSHDRRLVSLLAQEIWVVGNRTVTQFNGSLDEWLKLEEATPAPVRPARQPKPERARPVRKKAETVKERSATSWDNLMQAIIGLEEQVGSLEAQLQAASERQDLAEATRLAAEYAAAQKQLDLKNAEWAADPSGKAKNASDL